MSGSIVGAAALAFAIPSSTASASAPPAVAATCGSVPDGATFIATSPTGATVDRAGGSEALALPVVSPLSKVVRGPDGTVWVEAAGERGVEIHRVGADSGSEVLGIGEGFSLGSAGWLDGRSAAMVIDREQVRPGDPESSGAVVVEYADGSNTDLGPAGGIEYGVLSVSVGAGRVAAGAWADLTESFAYLDASGTELSGWFDPTDGAAYNAPPLFQMPVAATLESDGDAVVLSWVEGPDWDGATNERTGGWVLVVADAVSGTESLRLELGDAGKLLLDADFDGRFWVGTFDNLPGDTLDDAIGTANVAPGRVLVVDTHAETPAAADAGCPEGVMVTLDRLGTPEPPATPSPAPTTTVAAPATTTIAPSTTAAATCPSYTENTGTYPVKVCQKGAVVRNVQVQLVRNGYEIDTDNFFGPDTEAAVRAFQAAQGLTVDGLVGPDTWAALIADHPAGSDVDGNGTVEPWEVDPGGGEPRTPTVQFSPVNPSPGGTISVTGTGCEPGEKVIVWTQGALGTAAFEYPVILTTIADATGAVAVTTTVSSDLASGDSFDVLVICGDLPPAEGRVAAASGTTA